MRYLITRSVAMRKDACRVLLLLLLSCATITRALGEAIDTLQLKAEWESSVRHAEDTLRAQAFADHLRAYLEQSSNWKVPLPRFDGVSDVEAKGGALRLITWAFPLASREWAHMGFLVRPRRGGGVLCVPLRDKKLLVGDGMIQESWLTEAGDANSWVGAVYFDAKAFPYGRDTAYLLIGVAGYNAFVARRVIETLHVTPAGEAHFGLPLLMQGQRRLGRIMLSHGARVGAEINFVPGKNQVLMDHLSPSSDAYVGMPAYYGPDFSYDALELGPGGVWVYTTDVDPQAFNKPSKRKVGRNARVGRGSKGVGEYTPNWK